MGHCLEDSFHAKIPLKNDSTRSIHSVSPHWNYLRQGLYCQMTVLSLLTTWTTRREPDLTGTSKSSKGTDITLWQPLNLKSHALSCFAKLTFLVQHCILCHEPVLSLSWLDLKLLVLLSQLALLCNSSAFTSRIFWQSVDSTWLVFLVIVKDCLQHQMHNHHLKGD